jgi:hypothetical protein
MIVNRSSGRRHGSAQGWITGIAAALALLGGLLIPGTATSVPVLSGMGLKPSSRSPARTREGSPGKQLWVARYDDSFGDDEAYTLDVSPDGSMVFVSGSSSNSMGPDYATVAYDTATGLPLWVSRYDGPSHAWDYAAALKVSPVGKAVFVTGSSFGSGFDYATVAYDSSTGDQLWVARYKGSDGGDDSAAALAVSPDGSAVFVTGFVVGRHGRDYATVAYDATTGAEIWVKRYDGSGHGDDAAVDIGVSPDG